MKKEYRHLSDTNLENYLLRKENLNFLEALIEGETKQLVALRSQDLFFGAAVKEENLERILVEVKYHVDEFLQVEKISQPDCMYNKRYDSKTPNCYYDNLIVLAQTSKPDIIHVIAHEYAHHVQSEKGVRNYKRGVFKEGHARGVQKHIAYKYMETEDNPAYIYRTTLMNVIEFKESYEWLCEELQKEPDESLLKMIMDMFIKEKPISHSLGNSVMSILEIKHGSHVYADLINRKLVLPKMG